MPATTLHTARLTLSPMRVSDFQDLCALWGTEAFARSVFPAALAPEEVWTRLLRDIGHWQALGFGNWAVRETASGDYVGSVGLLDFRRQIDAPFEGPELGWGVAPRFQGRGMAFEAVSAALAWAGTTLGARRTVCMISTTNEPSHRLADRLGYRPYAETPYKGATYVLLERLETGPAEGAPASAKAETS